MTPAIATDRVPCAPLAEAFKQSGFTAAEVADRMGWKRDRWSATRVTRALGLARRKGGTSRWYFRQQMPYEEAVRFCEVLGVDPVEVGL